MRKLNTLIKVATESTLENKINKLPSRTGAMLGLVGGSGGALLGLGIGGLTHLLKSDKGLSQDERRQRLKKYLRRGTLIGGGAGLVGGGYYGYKGGKKVKDALKDENFVNKMSEIIE